MAIPVLGSIWQVARRVETLFVDVEKLVVSVSAMREELRQLEKRSPALKAEMSCWSRRRKAPPRPPHPLSRCKVWLTSPGGTARWKPDDLASNNR
jgi:hypothetical protein